MSAESLTCTQIRIENLVTNYVLFKPNSSFDQSEHPVDRWGQRDALSWHYHLGILEFQSRYHRGDDMKSVVRDFADFERLALEVRDRSPYRQFDSWAEVEEVVEDIQSEPTWQEEMAEIQRQRRGLDAMERAKVAYKRDIEDLFKRVTAPGSSVREVPNPPAPPAPPLRRSWLGRFNPFSRLRTA